ncbi:MAG: Holliday junction branch migration protein RuvA [Rhodospirillaceae bacterium]|nr:Holliday junction branch migration protein RuvA [Rhodospirillaceae bacterium]
MIATLKGLVDSVGDDWAVIDVAGVGYHVFCSARTLSALPGVGEAVSLSIETHVREDHIHLYGFGSVAEKDAFQFVTKVQGVGTKVALAILSILSPDQMAQAIAAQDKPAFTRATGVGPKLASRIVTELKDKVSSIVLAPALSEAPTGEKSGSAAADPAAEMAEDAVSALVNLGFGRADAFGAVSRALQKGGGSLSLDELIRDGLKDLSSDG